MARRMPPLGELLEEIRRYLFHHDTSTAISGTVIDFESPFEMDAILVPVNTPAMNLDFALGFALFVSAAEEEPPILTFFRHLMERLFFAPTESIESARPEEPDRVMIFLVEPDGLAELVDELGIDLPHGETSWRSAIDAAAFLHVVADLVSEPIRARLVRIVK